MKRNHLREKSLAIGIIFFFVGTYIIPANVQNKEILYLPTSQGNWLYVGGSGLGNYTYIQDAIDNASNGDTIFVYNGTYYEHVKINKNGINLIGENKYTTIIDGSGEHVVLMIWQNCNYNFISGFTIRNTSTNSGFVIVSGVTESDSSSNFNTLSDCIITDCLYYGIRINAAQLGCHVDNNKIINCEIFNCDQGILIQGDTANYNQILHTRIYHNNQYGILIGGITEGEHQYNIISNCTIYDNNGYGITLQGTAYNNLIYHNNFINNTINAYDNSTNHWNQSYPSGGNYWSDYAGVDNYHGASQNISGSDGIGDIPYDLPCEHALDWYPLILPYGKTKLTIIIQPVLFHLSIIIKNVGNTTAFTVQWIRITTGFVLLGKEASGILPKNLLPGEEIRVTSNKLFIGLGRIQITATAWADNAPDITEKISGILLLWFFKIN